MRHPDQPTDVNALTTRRHDLRALGRLLQELRPRAGAGAYNVH